MLIVRQSQLEAMSAGLLHNFKKEVLNHVKRSFRAEYKSLGESMIRDIIDTGLKRARRYGLTGMRESCGYIDLMFTFGPNFDKDTRFPWAASIVQDMTLPQDAKHAKLHDAADLHMRRAGTAGDEYS